jgi:hypothetical protein
MAGLEKYACDFNRYTMPTVNIVQSYLEFNTEQSKMKIIKVEKILVTTSLQDVAR